MENTRKRTKNTTSPQTLMEHGKVPPSAIDLEELVLGAIMLESRIMKDVNAILKPEVFYREHHQIIYTAIKTLFEEKHPIDISTVTNQLKKTGEIEIVGGPYYITQLTGRIASAANVEFHCRIIIQKWMQREIIRMSTEMNNKAYDDSQDVLDTLEYYLMEIKNIQEQYCEHDKTPEELVREAKKEAYLRANNYNKNIPNCIPTCVPSINKKIGGFERGEVCVIAARPSMGKALKMDTKILTPKGWVLNKNIKIGDDVVIENGELSKVTGIFPQGEKEMKKIRFIDGREIICSSDHLWEVYSAKFFNKKVRIINTNEIQEKLTKKRYKGRISIPTFEGYEGELQKFIIPPYLLGVLLGDGSLGDGVVFTNKDIDLIEKVKEYGFPLFSKGIRHTITWGNGQKNPLWDELKRYRLANTKSNNKFIPYKYKISSLSQRYELLAGLLDTDGSVDKNGVIEYTTVSFKLAKDVQEICWSLGFRCSMNKGETKLNNVRKQDRYRLVISTINEKYNLFYIKRKIERLKTKKKFMPLTISSVETVNKKEECQCISIESKRGLFIIDNYIVTHNTQFSLKCAEEAEKSGNNPLIISLEMTPESLITRRICSEADIDSLNYRTGHLSIEDLKNFDSAADRIASKPIHIVCASDLNSIISKIRTYVNKFGCEIVFIDYLQLIKIDNDNGNDNVRISKISRELNVLSKELRIPIVLLSQLNRKVEERGGLKMPMLSDLRDSGSVEQDGDLIMFLWRPAYYGIETFEYMGEQYNNMDMSDIFVIVAKFRNGAINFIHFKCLERMAGFKDCEEIWHRGNDDAKAGIKPNTNFYEKEEKDDHPF